MQDNYLSDSFFALLRSGFFIFQFRSIASRLRLFRRSLSRRSLLEHFSFQPVCLLIERPVCFVSPSSTCEEQMLLVEFWDSGFLSGSPVRFTGSLHRWFVLCRAIQENADSRDLMVGDEKLKIDGGLMVKNQTQLLILWLETEFPNWIFSLVLVHFKKTKTKLSSSDRLPSKRQESVLTDERVSRMALLQNQWPIESDQNIFHYELKDAHILICLLQTINLNEDLFIMFTEKGISFTMVNVAANRTMCFSDHRLPAAQAQQVQEYQEKVLKHKKTRERDKQENHLSRYCL